MRKTVEGERGRVATMGATMCQASGSGKRRGGGSAWESVRG